MPEDYLEDGKAYILSEDEQTEWTVKLAEWKGESVYSVSIEVDFGGAWLDGGGFLLRPDGTRDHEGATPGEYAWLLERARAVGLPVPASEG
jgi:hypothetical protein